MMAIRDAEYRFMLVDIGAYGLEGDAGVFRNTNIGKKIINNTLLLPPDASIENIETPFFFIADDAFPLGTRIIKPYSPLKGQQLSAEEIIFNYRLSRARRCIENAFSILVARWQCLIRTLFCSPDRTQKMVAACCVLHNYLLRNERETYCPRNFADHCRNNGELIEGAWRKNGLQLMDSLAQSARDLFPYDAKNIRDHLRNYVNSPKGGRRMAKESNFYGLNRENVE